MERGSLMDDGFATGSLLDRLQLPPDRDDDEPAPWLADPTYAVDGFREGLDQGTSIAA